ncbi:MAG: GntR family transcriptional regulator [Victivallaceae bacterium]|nr:GntR family transcriptional regulator [Victivallaceae bacterium]
MRLLKKEQVYKDIIFYILSEHLAVGNRIPTEEEFCRRFNVSRITLRSAVDRLVDEGILCRNGRNGTTIKQLPNQNVDDINNVKQILYVHFSSKYGMLIKDSGVAPEQIYRGIERFTDEHNDLLMVQSGDNFLKTQGALLRNATGVILGGNAPAAIFEYETVKRTPKLLISYPMPGSSHDSIFCDLYEAGYLACRNIAQQHKIKKILFLSIIYNNQTSLQTGYVEMLRGTQQFSAESAVEVIQHNVIMENLDAAKSLSQEQARLTQLISEHNIEAVVGCSGFLKELLAAYIDKKTPDKKLLPITIITPELQKKLPREITTFKLDFQKVGYLATKQLYNRIGHPNDQSLRISVPVESNL